MTKLGNRGTFSGFAFERMVLWAFLFSEHWQDDTHFLGPGLRERYRYYSNSCSNEFDDETLGAPHDRDCVCFHPSFRLPCEKFYSRESFRGLTAGQVMRSGGCFGAKERVSRALQDASN